MSTPTIVTGTDTAISATWKVGGVATAISGGGTVETRLVSTNYDTVYTGIIEQSSGAAGADWANGIIMIEILGTDTAAIDDVDYGVIQVKVTDGGKSRSGFFTVRIVKGNI